MFGIEEEFFIENSLDGCCPSLLQMDLVFHDLADQKNWQILQLPNTGCTWESPYGKVGIWNDFSTNILEIAYPVLDRPDQFIELRDQVTEALQHALDSVELTIVSGTVGFRRPDEIVLRPAPSPEYQIRLKKDIQRESNGRSLFCPYFYSNICSTQVSLSISKSIWTQTALGLYEYEHLIPLLYSRPIETNGKPYRCLRHFILADNWPKDPYVGYPESVAGLISGIEIQPEPRTLKYANCVFRAPNRVEFRSCDRLESSQQILEMTCLRLFALASAVEFDARQDEKRFRQLYLDACLDGSACANTIQGQLERFNAILRTAPEQVSQEQWGGYTETLFQKLEPLACHSSGLIQNEL